MKIFKKGYLNFQNKIDGVKFLYILAGLVFVAGLGLLVFFGYGYFRDIARGAGGAGRDLPVQAVEVPASDCKFRRILDGVCVDSEEKINPALIAVMIENHPDARPQSGLVKASIVYEAPVEANYTRFMAIFPTSTEVGKVGPVRSARPYYLDWLAEYGTPMYMHVGGSPDALDKIKVEHVFDVNEFYSGGYFWRSTERVAPHNAYTSSELWDKALKVKGDEGCVTMDEGKVGWIFGDATSTVATTTQITVSFLPPTYEAVWKFNSSTGKYIRFQDGRVHTDQDGTPIQADTVIVQFVKTSVLDDIGRIDMGTIGSGEAAVFRDGNMVQGTWKKTKQTTRTEWLDAHGNIIPLKAGIIWIEVLNQNSEMETK